MASLPKADDAFTQTRLMPTLGVSAERPAKGLKVRVYGLDMLARSGGYEWPPPSLKEEREAASEHPGAAVVGSKALSVLQRRNSLTRLRSTRTSAF